VYYEQYRELTTDDGFWRSRRRRGDILPTSLDQLWLAPGTEEYGKVERKLSGTKFQSEPTIAGPSRSHFR